MSRHYKRVFDLRQDCKRRGVVVEEKWRRADLVNALTTDVLRKVDVVPDMLRKRVTEYPSPMLCYPFVKASFDKRREILYSDKWGVEIKWRGVRAYLMWNPLERVVAYSRDVDERNFLPVDYAGMVCVFENKLVKSMGYLILGTWPNIIKSPSLKIRRKCYVMRCL